MRQLEARHLALLRTLVRALVRGHRQVFWAGASWATSPPEWFATASRSWDHRPPELGPEDAFEQLQRPDAPPGCALLVAQPAGASYQIVCGLLMPHELVVAAAMDSTAQREAVLRSIEVAVRTLASVLAPPSVPGGLPPGEGTPPTPLSKWAWLPLPDRQKN